jgi:NitT/TauT family transport system permease protein
MTSSTLAFPVSRPGAWRQHPLVERYAPIVTIVLALIAIWYIAAVLMNLSLVRDGFEREEMPYTVSDLLEATMSAERPLLPALLGIGLALMIVHSRVLEKSLLPWIICSQMVPILALAPIFIVVLGAIGLQGLLPKSIISAYLSFFPITIGMVKGFTSPDPMQLDLMRTWSANPRQVLSKVRWPSAVPYLFASLKVAVTISLIGAIVAELPTGGEAGIGARLLAGSYYGQTIQIWAALLASAILASGLIGLVNLTERGIGRQMGARP